MNRTSLFAMRLVKPALLLLLCALSLPTHAQTPSASASLTGRVVVMNGAIPAPIRRARVTATSPSGAVSVADSDTDGRYRFDGLAAGAYSIDVVKPGFYVAANAPNGVATAGTTAQVTEGASAIKDVVVERGASIEGVVLDRNDNPIADAVVQVRASGRERDTLNAVIQPVRSDDRGSYRIHSLPPGQYLVEAGSLDRVSTLAAPRSTGMPTYHPGSLNVANAKSVTVPPHGTVDSIDITMLNGLSRPGPPGGMAPATAPPAGTGARISGRITSADDGTPIAGAIVTLLPATPPLNVRRVTTDAQGRFDAPVRAATYRVRVSADGFVDRTYGWTRNSENAALDTRIELAEGGSFDRADVALLAPGAVEGRVVDEFGDPVPGVSVSLATPRFIGVERVAHIGFQIFPRPTDDRGMFRIFDVPPGDYYVEAASGPFVRGSDASGFALSYFPGTRSETAATLVRVESGRDRSGVNFSVVPAPLSELRGVVVTPDNAPVAQAYVTLLPMTGSDVRNLSARASGRTAADGTFVLRNIPEGSYALQAGTGSLNGYATLDAKGPVTTGARVEVRRPAAVRGRVVFEGDGPPPPIGDVMIIWAPMDFVSSPFQISGRRLPQWTDGNRFTIDGYVGRLVIYAYARPDAWVMTRVTRAGTDITDATIDYSRGDVDDIEITFKRIGASVSGRVTDGERPATDYTVVVFAADPAKRAWYSRFVKAGTPHQVGAYQLTGLLPGEYLAVALADAPAGTPWYSAAWLETIAATGTRVTLRDGESRILPLKLVK
jgi:hypothetical protein